MLEKESTDMFQAGIALDDIAVRVDSVNKSFTRWQRKERIPQEESPSQEADISRKEDASWKKSIWGREGFRNIFRQEKKIVTALDEVSFQIRQGEFVAYAGPNGADKSTTMKLLSGMLQPTNGTISVLGMSPEEDRIALMRKLGVLFGNRTELWWDLPVIQSFEWKKVVWDIPEAVYRRNLDMVTDLRWIYPACLSRNCWGSCLRKREFILDQSGSRNWVQILSIPVMISCGIIGFGI